MFNKKEFKEGFVFYISPLFLPYRVIKILFDSLFNNKKVELTQSEKCEQLIDLYLKRHPEKSREDGEKFVQKAGWCIKTVQMTRGVK